MSIEKTTGPTAPPSEEEEIRAFVGLNSQYYHRQFLRLDDSVHYAWTFNWTAAALGPVWMGARRLWILFWIFAGFELLAVVQLARGLWADLGAERFDRGQRLAKSAASRLEEAEEAAVSGASSASSLMESALALQGAARDAFADAAAEAAAAPWLVGFGIGLLLLVKLVEGGLANWAMAERFARWRADRTVTTGVNRVLSAGAALLTAAIYGVTVYRFTVRKVPEWLETFPAERSWRIDLANAIDGLFEWLTLQGQGFFFNVTRTIRIMLDAMETLLIGTPWPVVMAAIILLALRLAGPRVAIFTTVSLAYLALLGFWHKSMETVALLGTAALLCILVGIPLGIWCAKNRTVYNLTRPVLDLMQTMPAFVYLIPVIAFFGIGKPPGILATLIFGMPPVVRLTTLGLRGVPHSVREAATAFGASKAYLLLKVDLPLALPSIMTGVNQTILMCLSMVVIASLIGAKGLGEDVLLALTYAAEGQGILAGLAILFCAMILDRIVQGREKGGANTM